MALEMAHQDKAVARPLKFARWSSVCAMFALLALLIVGAVHQGMYQRRIAAPAERELRGGPGAVPEVKTSW